MVNNIEQRIYMLVRRYNGVYLFNDKNKQPLLVWDTDLDTDMQLDISEAENLMDDFFEEFQVSRGGFKIKTYYPDIPILSNPFTKTEPVPVPDFTIGMLITSAEAGKWLYD